MRKIHSKDTSIELLLRKALWHKGYHYRKIIKHSLALILFLPNIKLLFFVIVNFSRKGLGILKLRLEKKENPDFWIKKIERNRNRDYENDKKLLFLGYTVLHFWGQDITKHTDECLQAIEEAIWDIKFSDSSMDDNFPNKMYSYNSTSCLYLLTDSRPFIHKEYSCTQSLPPHSLYYSSF